MGEQVRTSQSVRRGRCLVGALALGVGVRWLVSELLSRRAMDVGHLAERIDLDPRRILVVVAGDPDVARDLHATFESAAIECVDVAGGPPIPDHGRGVSSVSPRHLVAGGGPYDLIVFARSAHAVEDALLRNAMFTRARTLLADGGLVAVVDRASDAAGLATFGPGALRFPRHAGWHAAFGAGGLRPIDQTVLPGHLHCWILRRRLSPV